MSRLIEALRWREYTATDIDIATAGTVGYLLITTNGRFPGCVSVKVGRDELIRLGDMIREYVDDRESGREDLNGH